ncbi:MAG TPA: c-type cytochrome [Longimicrobiales bacterium]
MQMSRFLSFAAAPLALLLAAGALSAQQSQKTDKPAAGTSAQPAAPAASGSPSTTPTPDAPKPAAGSLKNPYTGNPERIAAGKALWFKMSCYGCHGTMAGGGMGPNLTDAEWRYGGDDTSVFTTIKYGRPGGMPVWGAKLSDDEIFTVMAYIRSLYKGDPSTKVW